MSQTAFHSVNPATEETLASFPAHDEKRIEKRLESADAGFRSWRKTSFAERRRLLDQSAAVLRGQEERWARIITQEMGKPLEEGLAEIRKCAWNCDYYAHFAESFLAPRSYPSAGESYVQHTALGVVLAIMPWNYPFWQVFRFAAPALMAGNTVLLKHAANVPQCALALEEIFEAAGFPRGCFQSLLIPGDRASQLIGDSRIAAVTLTGSEQAGMAVAAAAGRALKKSVLELGGSDPFIVLEDAELEKAVKVGVQARFQNTGQSCIAAKRFIVLDAVYARFEECFVEETRQLKLGDPLEPGTRLGPLARSDLREDLERQVAGSLAAGARLLTGGRRPPGKGFFYEPAVLAAVTPQMPAGREEVFGPAAALFRVGTAEEAIQLANQSDYGLGCSLWTSDLQRARRVAPGIETGQVFVNQMVASDPRLPFGGIKKSGYGRELSDLGIREFVNTQTVSISAG